MTVVLVHGAWGGSWSWRGVADRLRAAGEEVFAPTLTGLAERSHVAPEHVTLSSHVSEIAGLMQFESLSKVLIVGHSYGGMVITGAADRVPDRIGGMLYIDAFVPRTGQSLFDIAGPERAAAHRAAAMEHDGGRSVPRPFAAGNSAPESLGRFDQFFTPQPIGTMSEPFIAFNPGQPDVPRHFALCAAYNPSAFHGIAARLKHEPGWSHSQFDAFHDVVRTHPDEVTALILNLARRWSLART